ncbi:VlhA.1.05 variable lipoprotein family protein [Mycoplasmoides gallisepticum str. R(low)]|uniref:VlhA.1.05 variable lipoprotein family protein n=2 Tax=Mycoplasmoides gallisepticum TaxID=2096 RepID=Q7NB54_MYCGA|nr:hypothetical protein [Mycoplasmoides gallisepticum]AAP56776.2 VlhA.1.05 variable lipoprotein family protein [Mycoplasmoides gallisepticum str. R(low)]ADC30631.1 VlhA.1.05 variable lipoprotein family protein [Mycoplasmoides gallisepticum str. R(high)]
MKTMKYIRIASLLGLGSIMSLGVTSCSLVVSKSIKAIKKPDDPSNKLPNKDDNNINIDTNQITDLQSNKLPNKDDNNINIDTNQITDLQSAKTILRNLITNQSATTESFDDYAKIKNSLSSAYTLANNVSNNSSASVDELKNAIRDLQAAINSAKNEKQDFDNKHPNLVQTYNAIKTSLSYQQDILDRLQDANYSLIKAHVTNLFSQAQVIINNTLVPVNDADAPILENLQSLNNKILSSARQELITTQINKVDNLVNRFEKFALNKQGLSGVDATRNNPQPWNYGFGGYSVDLGTGELTQPKSNTISTKSVLNYSYYRRMFWQDNTTLLSNQDGLTDVSWIYGLFGSDAKYSFTFNYYGPITTGYLYFPYKLVKSGDSVALQYKLNNSDPISIDFSGPTTNPAQTGAGAAGSGTSNNGSASASGRMTRQASSSEASTETPASTSMVNPTPTVSNIDVATVMLTNLRYGSNTIEFSLPANDSTKVAPMIGNMYISGSANNKDKVYNDIFGNQSAQESNSIIVNFATGYNLASDYSTFIVPYTSNLANISNSQTTKQFLIDFVGGSTVRGLSNNNSNSWYNNGINPQKAPSSTRANRTFIFYVNAPQTGDYSLSAPYYTSSTRNLSFSVNNQTRDNNLININNLLSSRQKNPWRRKNGALRQFDTSQANGDGDARQSVSDSTLTFSHSTLRLTKGINKIVVNGGSNGNDAPSFGNVTFRYVSSTSRNGVRS